MRSFKFIYLKSWRMYYQLSFNRLRKLQIKYQTNMNTLMISVIKIKILTGWNGRSHLNIVQKKKLSNVKILKYLL